jgi:hypothetical protein
MEQSVSGWVSTGNDGSDSSVSSTTIGVVSSLSVLLVLVIVGAIVILVVIRGRLPSAELTEEDYEDLPAIIGEGGGFDEDLGNADYENALYAGGHSDDDFAIRHEGEE